MIFVSAKTYEGASIYLGFLKGQIYFYINVKGKWCVTNRHSGSILVSCRPREIIVCELG